MSYGLWKEEEDLPESERPGRVHENKDRSKRAVLFFIS